MSASQSKSRSTTYDIAVLSGVSQPTVSRILAGHGERYRQATRDRVMAAARELDYRPHLAARTVRTGRHNAFALLLSTERERSMLSQEMLGGAHHELERLGYNLIVSPMADQRLTSEQRMPRVLRELAADGLLINYNAAVPEAMSDLIRRHRMPVVWVNRRVDADAVYPDDLNAGQTATRQLLRAGHRRVVFLDFTHKNRDAWLHYSILDRYTGYERVMKAEGLAPVLFGKATYRDDHTLVPALVELLRNPQGPTAFVCYGPIEARAAIAAAFAAGLDPHDDLGLIAFVERWQHDLGVDLTHMRLPLFEVGRTAVEMLCQKVDQPDAPLTNRSLPFTLVAGLTCRQRS